MSAPAQAVEGHAVGTTKLFVWVWVALLAMTGLEVFLAYERLRVAMMLTILMGLSIVKSVLIMSYFMHLKFEKLSLILWLIPALIFCICMIMIFFFPDSVRLMHLRQPY
jgi:cytochrome c oxidase subunit 4